MPLKTEPRTRRLRERSADSSFEESNPLTPLDSPSEEEEVDAPAPRRKRQRVNAERGNEASETFNTIDVISADSRSQLAYSESIEAAALSADATRREGFRPGSVIALGLKNFQVSSCIVWRFCASLNLVIGSNGSGKSTVITALYLLFQGRLDSLQRKGYAAFVQEGSEKAEITAVIQGKDGDERNPIVQMVIDANHTQKREAEPLLYLDHKLVTKRNLREFIARYNIQVNNLCQFLPQTRVAAFSGEPREERLISTETAVGYDGMVDHHEFLKEAGGRLNDVMAVHADLEKAIVKEEESRDTYKKVLERLDVSERKKADQRYYELLIPLIRHRESKLEVERLENELAAAKKRLEEVDPELREVLNAKEEAEEQLKVLNAATLEAEQLHDAAIKDIEVLNAKYAKSLARASSVRDKIDGANDALEYAIAAVAKMEKEKHKLNAQIADFKADQISEEEFSRLLEEYSVLKDQSDKLESDCDSLEKDLSARKTEYRETRRKIDDLKTKIHYLREQEHTRDVSRLPYVFDRPEIGRNFARTVSFVQEMINSGRLEGNVHMPPLLSVTITDARVLAQVEKKLSAKAIRTFVCESKQDLAMLSRLSRERNLELFIALRDNTPLDVPHGVRTEELRKFGFAGCIIDVLSGPKPVIEMLAHTLQIHKSPYALTEVPPQSRQRLIRSGFVGSFSDANSYYDVSLSRYGKRSQIIQHMILLPQREKWAQFMCPPNTQQEQKRYNGMVRDFEATIQKLEVRISSLQPKLEMAREAHKASVAAARPLKSQVKEAELTNKSIKNFENQLEEVIASQAARNGECDRFREKINRYNLEHASIVSAFDASSLVDQLGVIHHTEKNLLHLNWKTTTYQGFVARLEYVATKERNHLQEAVDSLTNQLSAAIESCEEEVPVYKKTLIELQAMKRKAEAQEEAKTIRMDEATNRVAELRAEINLNKTGDNYEETKDLLDSSEAALVALRQRKHEETQNLERSQGEVTRVRREWERELDKLVGIINDKYAEMFHQLGCQGNVVLVKDGNNFGNWGIDIEVSFRAGEPPKPLSRQRQSGGERAVSTAVYLLALQDLAKAPFRVVDEINQGMDEENERKTHQFLVSRACSAGSQYFLVTPKLLWDLPYHSMQDVAVIFSSPLIESGTISPPNSADEIIERYRAESQMA